MTSAIPAMDKCALGVFRTEIGCEMRPRMMDDGRVQSFQIEPLEDFAGIFGDIYG
jgi:hypothetical protein